MSNFIDNMIEDGFENPEEYMRYLENLSFEEYSNYNDFNIEEKDIYSIENQEIENIYSNVGEEPYEYYILPKDENWNKLIIKSIGSLIIPKRFDRKYCKVNNYSLGFYTYNFFDYHEASIEVFCGVINLTEREFFKKILSGDNNAFQEVNEYYKSKLFKHDSNNWKCSWDSIEIREVNGQNCLVQTYSIRDRNALYRLNCFTFFFNKLQVEIYTRYDPIRGRMNKYNWKSKLDTTINSFKVSNKIK